MLCPGFMHPGHTLREKGIIETEIDGDTLRALLAELSAQYKAANVDFQPINPTTNDLDFDYDVLVNGKNYVALAHGLDTKLKADDEVKLKILWRWDG